MQFSSCLSKVEKHVIQFCLINVSYYLNPSGIRYKVAVNKILFGCPFNFKAADIRKISAVKILD